MANFVYIATSLDGYIARADGSIDWLMDLPNPDQSDFGFGEFIKRVDAIILGRKTFDTVLAFDVWPYPKGLRVFVLSNTMKNYLGKFSDKVDIIQGEPKQVLEALHGQGFKNFYVD